ncbi:MAG TPA: ABC transporter permease [Bacteroidales bacterium]|nr:ABC transporter permease [Bacteroidales bacterium]
MRILQKLAYKDLLVLIRDRGGLAMLFIMPMALVLIMTSLQNNTFKAINESGINLILLNNDPDSLGNAIEQELENSSFFSIHRQINAKIPSEDHVREAVASGKFQIGIVVPTNATQLIRERVKKNVLRIFSGDTTLSSANDSIIIMLYIDPATKNSLRSTLQGSIREFSAKIESRIVFNELTREINRRMMVSLPNLNTIREEIVHYREEYVARNNRTIVPNAVQHNVPAWTLFAMFFIVIPFASAMIKEREDSSLARLLTMPCSYASILISKVIVYLIVCFLQFTLIMIMGVYLFPVLGLPALDIEGRLYGLSIIAIAASLAAVGYGVVVGTISRTHQQAAIFASISVVILAAIGGIWVPVFIMPSFMRELSVISPMNWGLHGFYDILVRNADLSQVIQYALYLLLFSAGCLLLALYYHKSKKDVV